MERIKKNFKRQKERGITLIALVITIIVLLILAGVSIAIVTGDNGILLQAVRAKEETRIANIKEQVELWFTQKNMQEKLQNGSVETLEEFLQRLNKEGLLNNNEVEEVKNTNKLIVGDETIYFVRDNLANVVSVGDFVGYNEGTENSYTSLAENNGCDNQIFKTTGSQKWRVLKVENGIVTLISENPIETSNNGKYYLKGKVAYLNGVQELNNICSIFGHGNGAKIARSITADDIINLCCDMEEYQIKYDYFDVSKVTGEGFFDFFDTSGNSSTSILRNYDYYTKLYTVIKKDSIEFKVLFENDNLERKEFWLATQAFNGNESGAWYNILYTNKSEATPLRIINGDHIYKANGDSVERSSYVRPIVELKEGIMTYGQDENGVWQLLI